MALCPVVSFIFTLELSNLCQQWRFCTLWPSESSASGAGISHFQRSKPPETLMRKVSRSWICWLWIIYYSCSNFRLFSVILQKVKNAEFHKTWSKPPLFSVFEFILFSFLSQFFQKLRLLTIILILRWVQTSSSWFSLAHFTFSHSHFMVPISFLLFYFYLSSHLVGLYFLYFIFLPRPVGRLEDHWRAFSKANFPISRLQNPPRNFWILHFCSILDPSSFFVFLWYNS